MARREDSGGNDVALYRAGVRYQYCRVAAGRTRVSAVRAQRSRMGRISRVRGRGRRDFAHWLLTQFPRVLLDRVSGGARRRGLVVGGGGLAAGEPRKTGGKTAGATLLLLRRDRPQEQTLAQ